MVESVVSNNRIQASKGTEGEGCSDYSKQTANNKQVSRAKNSRDFKEVVDNDAYVNSRQDTQV